MHPYIPHLLSDIAEAIQPEKPYTTQPPKSFEEKMEEVERWCDGEDAPHTFGYWCGLNKENFPPAVQLEDVDMLLVCEAFEEMMFSYQLNFSVPDGLPVSMRYQLIIEILDEKLDIPEFGCITFDNCTGYAPDCKFKEYCRCLQFWNELPDDDDEMLKLPKDGELPF